MECAILTWIIFCHNYSFGSFNTGITNNSGIAEVNVSNVTGLVTFTASYSNVTAQCTVNATGYLFYDECTSADGLSNYGSIHQLRVQNANGTLSYDSEMNAYKFTPTSVNDDGFIAIPIPALDNKDGYYVEAEIYTTDTSTGGQSGLSLYPTSDGGGNGVFFRDIASINRCGVLKFANYAENGESGNSQQSGLPVGGNWYKIRLEVNGTSVTGKWLKTDDTLVYSHTYTVPYTSGAMRVALTFLAKYTYRYYYVRNIKASLL